MALRRKVIFLVNMFIPLAEVGTKIHILSLVIVRRSGIFLMDVKCFVFALHDNQECSFLGIFLLPERIGHNVTVISRQPKNVYNYCYYV